MLEAADRLRQRGEFQSLSKRSNLPGLRIGFVAGDRTFLARFLELRNVAAPQVPMPTQRVAIAAYGDEAHVEENRRLYAQKFDLADQIIGDRYGYRRPAGGFFLWLDVSAQGGDEAAALRLWREAGLRVVPGHYLARGRPTAPIPGKVISALPWCRTAKPRPRRCIASSRCWARWESWRPSTAANRLTTSPMHCVPRCAAGFAR